MAKGLGQTVGQGTQMSDNSLTPCGDPPTSVLIMTNHAKQSQNENSSSEKTPTNFIKKQFFMI